MAVQLLPQEKMAVHSKEIYQPHHRKKVRGRYLFIHWIHPRITLVACYYNRNNPQSSLLFSATSLLICHMAKMKVNSKNYPEVTAVGDTSMVQNIKTLKYGAENLDAHLCRKKKKKKGRNQVHQNKLPNTWSDISSRRQAWGECNRKEHTYIYFPPALVLRTCSAK